MSEELQEEIEQTSDIEEEEEEQEQPKQKLVIPKSKEPSKSWFARYNSLPEEQERVDLDDIKQTNFFEYMRGRLLIPPDRRTEKDIEILKRCARYLDFFANIIRVDPQDTLKSLENGFKRLVYRKLKKGEVICKHKGVSDEFYINLIGRIGIFLPKNRDLIKSEIEAIEWVIQAYGDHIRIKNNDVITYKQIKALDKKFGEKHMHYKHWITFQEIRVEEKKVVYRNEYIQETCGGLSIEDIPLNSGIFNPDEVNIFFTFQLLFFLIFFFLS